MMFIGDWQWVDPSAVFGFLDWIGFLIGGIGIWLTFAQLVRSKGALEAAREALEGTRASLIRNQIAEVLPRFQTTIELIDRSLTADDYRFQLDQHLERLILYSRETVELIDSYKEDLGQASYDVASVAKAAEAMRARLYSSPEDTAEDLTQSLRWLRATVSKIHSLTVRLRNDPGQVVKLKEGL